MIERAANATEADGDGAAAFTQSYMRLRGMVRDLVGSSSATLDEFDRAFPAIEVVAIASEVHPRTPHARNARLLLGQLGGWVSGLIAEIEYEQGSHAS